MPDDPKTGTPQGQQDDGAGKPGTPALELADDGDAGDAALSPEQRAEKYKNLYLGALPKIEEANALKRERAAQPAAPPSPPPSADVTGAEQQRQRRAQLEYLRNAGDPVAAEVLEREERENLRDFIRQQEIALAMAPAEHRDDIVAAVKAGKAATVDQALRDIRTKSLEAENAKLKKETEAYRRAEEARKAGVVGAGPSVPVFDTKTLKEPKSLAEFNQNMDRLEREDPSAARELSRRFRKGELPFQK